MNKYLTIAICIMACCFACSSIGPDLTHEGDKDKIVYRKIWDEANHNAFTDLIFFRGNFYCSFREGIAHEPTTAPNSDGTVRILISPDGVEWKNLAVLEKTGVDLRDPKLSVTPEGKIMVIIGGSIYENGVLKKQVPHVAFSDTQGLEFSSPEVVELGSDIPVANSNWIWRVTWHKGIGYAFNYQGSSRQLVKTTDGKSFDLVYNFTELDGYPNEATVRFDNDGLMHIVIRREQEDQMGLLATAQAPFQEWEIKKINYRIGGPNLIFIGEEQTRYIGTRVYLPYHHMSILREESPSHFVEAVILPSSGDCSYPGMVVKGQNLYLSYYSSHEGKSSIYFSIIPLSVLKTGTAHTLSGI